MSKFSIPGVPFTTPRPRLADTVAGVKPQQGVRVEGGRASSALQTLDGEFAEVVLTGGVRLWGATTALTEDLATAASRSGGEGPPRWNVTLGRGSGSRGAGKDLAVEAVQTFELEIADSIQQLIASRVENGKEAGGLLHQCVPTSAAAFNDAASVAGTGPTLLFIHGTASSTDGSFGGLWEAVGANRVLRIDNPGARINTLFKAYEGRIFAFDHRSLTESPIANAVALMEQLARVVPGGRELHVVTHSRGGMIGELLCRGMRREGAPIDSTDVRLFPATDEREPDRQALADLGRLLTEQRYRIGRFVRVACPAAGTTLADGRLDRYLSVLVNVAGTVTGLGADPMYQALTNLLAAVLKTRTSPAQLPGLEAMMPTSPLARLLNRRDVLTSADLHVLGGDLAVRGFWSALKALATDFFYLEDHDLVVNTPSMLRGTPRTAPVKYFIDTDGDVSHFNYFRRADTAERLTTFLSAGGGQFRTLDLPPYEVDGNAYQKRGSTSRPTVVLVPGFMGSHLSMEGGRVWADPARLAQGGFALLSKPKSTPADAQSTVGPYTDLATHLDASHTVVLCPYDWRQSAQESAAVLRTRLAQALDGGDPTQPIRVVTHGAGGLVFLAMLADKAGAETWARVCAHPGARAVLLGCPFSGTAHALFPLLQCGPLFEGLAAIDLVHEQQELAAVFAGFPGLLQLLPDAMAGATPAGWFTAEPWKTRAVPPGLTEAYRLRKALVVPNDARVIVVTGKAPTPARLEIVNDRVIVHATLEGDGYSPWSGIPEHVRERVWLADTDHGGLVSGDEVKPAVVDLLATGTTRRLGRLDPKSPAAAASLPYRLHLPAIPSDAELIAAGLGFGNRTAVPARPKVRVKVVHGSLSHATSPVVVGHYDQDGFANAEEYLDRQLDGRLNERRQMRLYPGAIGTVAVELGGGGVSNLQHPGAIVVGLGVVGTLTAGGLIRTLEDGLTAYGAKRLGEHGQQGVTAASDATPRTVAAPVTSLLVGSGEAGLSLRDSLYGLLRGILGANARLAAPALEAEKHGSRSLPVTARIDSLEIVELYEDRAVEALRMLLKLALDADVANAFDVSPLLRRDPEGRQRVSFEEPPSWWQRLRVTEHDASVDPNVPTSRKVLKFEAYAERARIDAFAVGSQREKAGAFIDGALRTMESRRHLGRTLFEMLVPNAIKDLAPDRRDTVLLLDTASAAIPWELFEDGLQVDGQVREPLAIAAGMIRQLVDERPRPLVRQATGQAVLVVGNPRVDDTRFADLPGAKSEAEAVAQGLSNAFNPVLLVGSEATTEAILTALHEKPWRVLHLALHGVFRFPKLAGSTELVTGAVIAKGVYLEPGDFNQMRYVPELVFLNCCHGGDTSGDAHVPRHPELAANLATQFISMGAKVVVAAGWAVQDAAAGMFARVFYELMLDGHRFGEATHRARRAVYQHFPEYNTWGAYQCYGDPDFVLTGSRSNGHDWTPVYIRELIVTAETIASEAKLADERAFDGLLKRLDAAVLAADGSWLKDARVCVALGSAYGELKQFQRAIEYYDTARQAEKAECALSALEQLANLEGRYAEQLWRDATNRPAGLQKQVDDHFRTAERLLVQLVEVQKTAERCSMLGGLEKRRAMTRVKPADAVKALLAARRHYDEAYKIKTRDGADDAFYPFVNGLVVQLAACWLNGVATTDEIQKTVDTLKTIRQSVTGRGFWTRSFHAEAELLHRINEVASKRAPVNVLTDDAVVDLYRKAQKRGRSRREIDSVVTQIRFLADCATRSTVVPMLGHALGTLVRQLVEA